ncbi:two-component sensor histidine kinase [Shewanella rhizosphaerae]|uniref:ATP-binding protein n=1 Tax=Shewanella rhizosphaerae TaxID=2864207 RepID=UPI001C65A8AD|nr:ATP-binding protein [Shewanella rhizosphaerae]QYK13719.1 two-component sensor histidine kinase [Shewanella rhizosphaerae]
MKFQFYRLYALLILSSALIIWSFSEIHGAMQHQVESYQIDVDSVFRGLSEEDSSVLIRQLSRDELALPQDLADKLDGGETIALTLSGGKTYYYRQAPEISDPNDKEPAKVIAFGPVLRKPTQAVPTELIIFALYASLGCLALLLIWPLFRDLSQLQASAVEFGANPRKMEQTINKRSAIYPLAKVFHEVTVQIVDFLHMHKELSRTISHEVRTPLARMRFALQLSKAELDEKYWQRLNADIDEIEQLANNYLSFAKLEHREAQIKKEAVSTQAFLDQLEEKFALYQDKIGITFIADDRLAVFDTSSMSIATQNLIMNALRFAKQTIQVRFRCEGDLCQITVEDDGPGFEGKGKQLLAAFARDKEQSDGSGYGLGLYIARKIAIWHQGRLEVAKSDELGGASLTLVWRNQPAK